MLPFFAKDTVKRVRPGVKQARGSARPDWDAAEELEIAGCSVQPASTSASLDLRVSADASMTAYMPAGADIRMGDRVDFNGERYSVMGEPQTWPGMDGASHMIVALHEWRG